MVVWDEEKRQNELTPKSVFSTQACAMSVVNVGRASSSSPPLVNPHLRKCPTCSLVLRNAGGSVNSKEKAGKGGTRRDPKPLQTVPAAHQESSAAFPAPFQVSASVWRVPVSLCPQAGVGTSRQCKGLGLGRDREKRARRWRVTERDTTLREPVTDAELKPLPTSHSTLPCSEVVRSGAPLGMPRWFQKRAREGFWQTKS